MFKPQSKDNLKLLQEKLHAFQRQRIIIADPSRQFELDQNIKEIQQQIQELKKDNLLYEALLSLNYDDQVNKFNKFWTSDNNRQAGCFLLQGKSARGQSWLLNRLLQKSFHDTTDAKKISISLSAYRESYIEDLWTQLSQKLQTSASPRQLVSRLYEYWQTETVIIVFHNLDRMYPEDTEQLIDRLWCPLVEKVQQNSRSCSSYLVMFLVDNKGRAPKWRLNLSTDINQCEPSQPIDLHPISDFPQGELKIWVMQNRNLPNFPEENQQLQYLAQEFWETSSQGNPELVMSRICEHCDFSWSDMIKQLSL